MTTPTRKLLVATELLDRALRLYYEGNSDFAALHLAGAAEELLAKHIEAKGGESSFTNLRDAAVGLSKYLNESGEASTPKSIANVMNHAKNATKHMALKDDQLVFFDARSEAHDLLDRAVSNYYQAMSEHELEETELVRRFNHDLTAGA
jgi:hypothetical protein